VKIPAHLKKYAAHDRSSLLDRRHNHEKRRKEEYGGI
jgi:hypothetical protein